VLHEFSSPMVIAFHTVSLQGVVSGFGRPVARGGVRGGSDEPPL